MPSCESAISAPLTSHAKPAWTRSNVPLPQRRRPARSRRPRKTRDRPQGRRSDSRGIAYLKDIIPDAPRSLMSKSWFIREARVPWRTRQGPRHTPASRDAFALSSTRSSTSANGLQKVVAVMESTMDLTVRGPISRCFGRFVVPRLECLQFLLSSACHSFDLQ